MILSPEEHLALANPDPEWEHLVENSPPFREIKVDTDIHKLRTLLANTARETAEREAREGEKPYIEEDRQIPVRDGATIAIRVHKPRNLPQNGCPVLVFYHGGGFCIGGLYSEMILCRAFTQLGGIAINVDYRLAPEYPFPVGVHDAHDALKWTAAHLEELGGNPSKGFIVGGVSAGANLASISSHLYIQDDKMSPPLTGQYLSILPAGDEGLVPEKYKHVYLARKQCTHTPVLNDVVIAWFNEKTKFDVTSRLRGVLAFESHKGMPPSYFQVCGADPLRDEALIYEDILKEDYGTKTRLDVYPGLPHAFWTVFPEATFTKKFREDCVKGLEWLLSFSS